LQTSKDGDEVYVRTKPPISARHPPFYLLVVGTEKSQDFLT
jgi:hypothetical protein